MCDILFLLLKNKPRSNRVTAPKIYGLAMNYDNLLCKKSISQIFLKHFFFGVIFKRQIYATIHQCTTMFLSYVAESFKSHR